MENTFYMSNPLEFSKKIILHVEELLEIVPPEFKELATGLFTNGLNITTTGNIYFSTIQPLKSIAENLVNGASVTSEIANDRIKNCKETCSLATDRKDELLKIMKSKNECSVVIYNEMQNKICSAADSILIVGLFSSGIFVIVEGYKLYNFWEKIKDAKNLVEKSPGQLVKISTKLSEIKDLSISLEKAMTDVRKGIENKDFELGKNAADYFIGEIQDNIWDTLLEIRELSITINGMKMELSVKRSNAVISTVTNSVSAGVATTNVCILASLASPYLIILTSAFATVHVILAISNVALHKISDTQFKELQKEVEEIENFRKSGMEIFKKAKEISKEIREHNCKFDLSKYK